MEKYEITMNLNVLNHLGINLYSNIPAVLSEVVANAWDADASEVSINIEDDKVIIEDNGCGMDQNDINRKYLTVGYQKRIEGTPITPHYKRSVMGRKGIGKLSLFSIAKEIEVHTFKDGNINGFRIDTNKLEEKIKNGEETYNPEVLSKDMIEKKSQGTKIILSKLKKDTTRTASYLKKRLARRFSIIGEKYNFRIFVNQKEVEVSDRNYFNKLENLWVYSDDTEEQKYREYCSKEKLVHYEVRKNEVNDTQYKINGWIGSVKNSGELKDGEENLNKIVIMVRGKMAQEDILVSFLEGGLYFKYLIGEIHADFLDLDHKDDIATSSRQDIKEDDPRYQALKKFILKELKYIQSKWSNLRNEQGKKEAFKSEEIKNWFSKLGADHKKKADSLFGKINQLTLDHDEKKDLFKHSVLAFESFKYKRNLEALELISPENLGDLSKIISNFDDIEATLYHQIVTERLKIIEVLQEKVDDNALEKVVQQHLYEHLWLLDPSWDRATELPYMEQTVQKEFDSHTAKLSQEEQDARIDIKYKKASGKHIIIELKRAGVTVSQFKLLEQISKYHKTLSKILESTGKSNEPIEIICLLGKHPREWDSPIEIEKGIKNLETYNARVVTYKQLINDAQRSYQEFIKLNQEAGRVTHLIESIQFNMD